MDDLPYVVCNLSWGLQSWTLTIASLTGRLPLANLYLFADTTWERKDTYLFAQKWEPFLMERVSYAHIYPSLASEVVLDGSEQTHVPAFTVCVETGKRGRLRRSCTDRWKIAPMRREISWRLRAHKVKKSPGVVEQWIGYTTDEMHRAADTVEMWDTKYITPRFPLIEMGLSRTDCEAMLRRWGYPVPPKSSCVFCPNHSAQEWASVLNSRHHWDRQIALAVDKNMRHKRPGYNTFLHTQCLPLAQVAAARLLF